MFNTKRVVIIQDIDDSYETETVFTSDTLPMAKHFADTWAKRNDMKLIKSPKKIAELFPSCRRVSTSENEVIFYAIPKS